MRYRNRGRVLLELALPITLVVFAALVTLGDNEGTSDSTTGSEVGNKHITAVGKALFNASAWQDSGAGDRLLEDRVIKVGDGEHAFRAVAGEVLVQGVPGRSEHDISAWARSVGSELIEFGPRSGLARLRVPQGETIASFKEEALRSRLVLDAGPDAIAVATSCPMGEYREFQWNLDMIELGAACEEYSSTLGSVVVAVLDTGIAYENYQDETYTYIMASDLADVEFVQGYDFVNDDEHPNDDHQHGTHIAGTIAAQGEASGVAPGVQIMPVKVLGSDKIGNEYDVLEGIYYAVDHGADVINMSLAFDLGYFPSMGLQRAIAYAQDNGVLLVGSAGNLGEWGVLYPAALPDVISAGAARLAKVDGELEARVAKYSEIGFGLDLLAPGGRLQSDKNKDDYPDGILAQAIDLNAPDSTSYWFYTGTSEAAAHVSGMAAWLLADGASPSEVRPLLLSSTDDLDFGTFHPRYGAGLGQLEAARDLAVSGAEVGAPKFYVNLVPWIKESDGMKRAVVRAEVIDENGRHAPNVLVAGSWFGSKTKFKSRVWTDSDGVALIRSPKVDASEAVAFGFQVDLLLEDGMNWGERSFQFYALTPALAETLGRIMQEPEAREALVVYKLDPNDEALDGLIKTGSMLTSYVVKPVGPGMRSGPFALVFDEGFIPELTNPDPGAVTELDWTFDEPLLSGRGEVEGVTAKLVHMDSSCLGAAEYGLLLPFDPGMGHLDRQHWYPVVNAYDSIFLEENRILGNAFSTSIIADGFSVSIIADSFTASVIGDAFSASIIADTFTTSVMGDTFTTSVMGDAFITTVIADEFASAEAGLGFGTSEMVLSASGTLIGDAAEAAGASVDEEALNACGNEDDGSIPADEAVGSVTDDQDENEDSEVSDEELEAEVESETYD